MKEKNDNLKAKSPLFRLQELVESFESTFHSDAVHSPEIAVPMQQFSDPVHRMYLARKTPIPKRAAAAPPTSIQIQGYSQHAKVEVREGEELTLTCVVPNARPAAQIVWYRANVEYKSSK
ncbi:AGAP010745-PA [Anopheles gambiae str. PEST]|uniref:AGAP010745-PA n=1 Tax=Anopheles gambiae TaxID=7165 RepID=A7UV07_ANOGA|nr:AGAP010745-PA [Anopheles gambiae str. PEST]